MLVLARKLGEGIQIGDGVVLKITRVKGKEVRISIEAPKDVKISRVGEDGEVEVRRSKPLVVANPLRETVCNA